MHWRERRRWSGIVRCLNNVDNTCQKPRDSKDKPIFFLYLFWSAFSVSFARSNQGGKTMVLPPPEACDENYYMYTCYPRANRIVSWTLFLIYSHVILELLSKNILKNSFLLNTVVLLPEMQYFSWSNCSSKLLGTEAPSRDWKKKRAWAYSAPCRISCPDRTSFPRRKTLVSPKIINSSGVINLS